MPTLGLLVMNKKKRISLSTLAGIVRGLAAVLFVATGVTIVILKKKGVLKNNYELSEDEITLWFKKYSTTSAILLISGENIVKNDFPYVGLILLLFFTINNNPLHYYIYYKCKICFKERLHKSMKCDIKIFMNFLNLSLFNWKKDLFLGWLSELLFIRYQ